MPGTPTAPLPHQQGLVHSGALLILLLAVKQTGKALGRGRVVGAPLDRLVIHGLVRLLGLGRSRLLRVLLGGWQGFSRCRVPCPHGSQAGCITPPTAQQNQCSTEVPSLPPPAHLCRRRRGCQARSLAVACRQTSRPEQRLCRRSWLKHICTV